jgi:hypothetical protein
MGEGRKEQRIERRLTLLSRGKQSVMKGEQRERPGKSRKVSPDAQVIKINLPAKELRLS